MSAKTATLEVVDRAPAAAIAVRTADLPALAGEINETHAVAKSHAQLAVVFAVRTGILCMRAKDAIEHGAFQEWLEKNCPEITDRTARRYMALVSAAKNESGSFLMEGGKTDTVSDLTAAGFLERVEHDACYRNQVSAQVREVVGEGSLTELYKDWGVVHGPRNIDEATGKRKHYEAKPKKLSPAEVAKENRAAAKARIIRALSELKAAIDDKQMRRWLEPKDWIDLEALGKDRLKTISTLAAKAHAAAEKKKA